MVSASYEFRGFISRPDCTCFEADDQGEPPLATWIRLGLLPKYWSRSAAAERRHEQRRIAREAFEAVATGDDHEPHCVSDADGDDAAERARLVIEGLMPVKLLHPTK